MAIPPTINGMQTFEVLSAMQKYVRRGNERQAMLCWCELAHTSKAFFSMANKRLEIISHEDIGLANPMAAIYTAITIEQVTRFYHPGEPIALSRMLIGGVIRLLCRSPKSRENDHFGAAVGGAAWWDGVTPEIPDYALDPHTHRGRKLGRGLDYFMGEATKLIPDACQDEYRDEAYEHWRKRGVWTDREKERIREVEERMTKRRPAADDDQRHLL